METSALDLNRWNHPWSMFSCWSVNHPGWWLMMLFTFFSPLHIPSSSLNASPKPSMFQPPAPDLCSRWHISDLGAKTGKLNPAESWAVEGPTSPSSDSTERMSSKHNVQQGEPDESRVVVHSHQSARLGSVWKQLGPGTEAEPSDSCFKQATTPAPSQGVCILDF